jgi:ribosomal protein S18 acetylase RimI-like enzyme
LRLKRKDFKATNTILFHTDELSIAPVDENNIRPILDVYRQSEDFLSLGPVSKASMKMVRDDIEHSKNENGRYCCIKNSSGNIVGVLDFIPVIKESGTGFLSLLMIAEPYRRRGYGKAIIAAFGKYLIKLYKTKRIKSAVQTNNTDAIQFWRKAGYNIDSKPEHRPDKTIVYNMSKELR